MKTLFLRSLLTFFTVILLLIGSGVVVQSCTHRNEIEIILGTDLPNSVSGIDYRISYGWDGASGILCAKIPRSDFLKLIKEIHNKRGIEQKKYPKFDDLFQFSPAKLTCWTTTNPYNEDTYVAVTRDYFMVIKYENEILLAVLSST
jgi:hypothetical protein